MGKPDRVVGLLLKALGLDGAWGDIGRTGTRLHVETQVPIIVGDVTIQGTGLATESKQDTQITALELIRDRLLHGGKSAAQWLSDIAAAVTGTLTVAVTNFPASVEVSNDLGNPVPISGTVAVANPTADPETGLAKEVTLQQVSDRLGTSVEGTVAQVLGYIMGRIGSVTGKTLASLLDAIDAKVATETSVAASAAALGTTSDADTLSTVIGRLKKIVALLAGGLPSALSSDRLKTESVSKHGTRTHFTAAPTVTEVLIRAANSARLSVTFVNAGVVTVYLGETGVTTTTGTPLTPGATLHDPDSTEDWYGVTAAGTGDIRGWETV